MPVTLATWEAKISSFGLRPAREKIHETQSPKATRAKWTRGVAQVTESLPHANPELKF
jgi:hypothetical protein